MIVTLKSTILVLASVDGLFLFKVRFSWFLVWPVNFDWNLDILGIMLRDTGSYLDLF